MSLERHYEVLILRRKGWILESIIPERQAALAHAHELCRIEGSSAVKVVYSNFDSETGLFEESELHQISNSAGRLSSATDARKAPVERNGIAVAETTVAPKACRTTDDLYGPDGCRTIGTVLSKQLDAWVITATELLHCPAHVARLHDAGTTLQAAVQRAAITLSHQGNGSASALVKQIYDAITGATRRLNAEFTRETGAAAFRPLAAAAHSGGPEQSRRLFMMIADGLSDSRTWTDKIDLLFSLLPDDPELEELRAVDRLTTEILLLSGGLSALLKASKGIAPSGPATGPGEDAGRRSQIEIINDVLDLIDQKAPPEANHPVPPGARRLLALLRSGRLPDSGEALLARIALELDSPRLLTGPPETLDLRLEARAIRDIGSRLAGFVGGPSADEPPQSKSGRRPLVNAGGRIMIALENRSEALLRPERLGAFLGAVPELATSISVLLELGHNLVGELNRRRVGKHLLARIGNPSAVNRLTEVGGSQALTQLRMVVSWQDDVVASDFPPDLRDRLAAAFDYVCVGILDRLQMFKNLARQKPDPLEQAMAIVDLAGARALTRGSALTGARRRALACISAAGGPDSFAAALAKRSLSADRLDQIHRFLTGAL